MLLALSSIKDSKATEALHHVSDAFLPETTVSETPQELANSSDMKNSNCIKYYYYDDLKSCLDDDTHCFVFNLYNGNDFSCNELENFYKYVCPCESLGDEYEDEVEYKYDYCGEFAHGCRRACRKYLTNSCNYPNDCDY